MHVVCIRMLLSASICLSTLQKHEGGIVLILKSAWGVLSTLYFWAWGVLSAFKKACGGFRPPITKWTWGVLSVGCFVLHSKETGRRFIVGEARDRTSEPWITRRVT